MTTREIHHQLIIPSSLANQRLDAALATLLPQYSRTRLQEWLKNGCIVINGNIWQPKNKVSGGEYVTICAQLNEETISQPENIPFPLVYEDDDIIIINKPIGMVVHPAPGHRASTLLNALLHHAPQLHDLPRAGIIHRLDKDTSGLMIIAKTLQAHTFLVKVLEKRQIEREYEAIVQGKLIAGGKIDAPIGRHPKLRTHMAIIENGKPAITHYWVIERFKAHTHIKIKLETGRTHQIRVHMAYQHHPIVGDQVYAGRLMLPKGASPTLIDVLKNYKHQALHARRLSFIHPTTQENVNFEAKRPEDMESLLTVLKEDSIL